MYIYQIMNNSFGFIDIILLAMIAGFIILRLRNILGKRTGHEGKSPGIFDDKKYSQFKPEVKAKPILKDILEESEKKDFLKVNFHFLKRIVKSCFDFIICLKLVF